MINLRSTEEDYQNYNTFNTSDISDTFSSYENNTYNICFISSCLFILYFLLTVPAIFLDIIFGVIYNDNYSIISLSINIITISKWLITNGILCYINLVILILLKRVYTDDTFFRKILKFSGYIITIIVLMWTILGIVIFFVYYYKNYENYENYENGPTFFYNYLFIRIVLSPLILILRFVEIYNI